MLAWETVRDCALLPLAVNSRPFCRGLLSAPDFASAPFLPLHTARLQAVGAAADTQLKPNPIKAEKAVEQALRTTYKDEHGEEIPPALIYKNYDCTKTVSVLPPRMAVHSDSCSLWRKSGHVEDE